MVAAASLPPPLPGLDPNWSRLVDVPDADGTPRAWHVLDSGAANPDLTLLCVHGNPTWSYLWRTLIRRTGEVFGDRVRVVAVDQLEMGFSERTDRPRRLADRIDDLDRCTQALGITGPVVTVAHDWGGPISLGWAMIHVDQLVGVVLGNTAVHQPAGAPAPAVIRAARFGPMLDLVTRRTKAFIRGTMLLSRNRFSSPNRMPREVADAFAAPYATADRRRGIEAFVADIPLETGHPSAASLDAVALGLACLSQVPVLLLWGPGDPVFSDLYLRDLRARLPHADVHRYEGARHLVFEDAPQATDDLMAWLAEGPLGGRATRIERESKATHQRLWEGLQQRAQADPDGPAVIEMGKAGVRRQVTWGELNLRVDRLTRGLAAQGIMPGDRVSLLIPVSIDLVAVIYACWRIGAAAIVTDAGLGLRGMRRAIRGAHADHVIGIRAGLALTRGLGIPGRRIRADDLAGIERVGADADLPPEPDPRTEAVIAFTSGATGPAKGVIYRHWQVERTRDAIASHYEVTSDDALIAAFAPWAVLGPALQIASAIPAMDVTKPSTLTATALADAAAAVDGSLLWSSPAALANVLRTQSAMSTAQREALGSVRIAMFAGAPVPLTSLTSAQQLFARASVRTPYGMTEALPLTDVTVQEILVAGSGNGVLVGEPIEGVEVSIAPLDAAGRSSGSRTTVASITGEICVRCDHMRDGYDALWATTHRGTDVTGSGDAWHRTGDVGHLDEVGRLWVEGRMAHVIVTEAGPVTPVGIEQRTQQLPWVQAAAAVGVGPRGCQQLVVIVTGAPGSGVLLDVDRTIELRDHLRDAGLAAPAAVLRRDELPVDIRHQAKVDRAALAAWAEQVLAGARSRARG